MLFSPRISLKNLAGLCHRLATSLEAGIDARTVWQREAERARGSARKPVAAVRQAIEDGRTLTEALAAGGEYFPPLFRELAGVGEATGREPEVFAQLADHYQQQIVLRRTFLAAIAWPMLQLGFAILVVGFLIWIMGVVNRTTGGKADPLGFGLLGERGLAIYAACVSSILAAIGLLIFAIRRGVVWTRPIQRAALYLPVIGGALETLALARLAWSMHLTFHTGMDVRRALKISLQSAGNARYLDDIPKLDAQIAAGNSVHAAFSNVGRYPTDFLDTLAVSEQSGRLSESLGVLSRQYRDRARFAMAALTSAAGFLVWLCVAAILIVLIFRLFGFYVGTINDAARGF